MTTLEHVKVAPKPSHTSSLNKTILERKRDEKRAKPDLFFNVVRRIQDGDEQPQWSRVREMLRTSSVAGQLTKGEEEEEWQRLRQAVLITEFNDVVDNASELLRSAPPLGPERSHPGQLQRLRRDGAVSAQSAHASLPRVPRKHSNPATAKANPATTKSDDAPQPRVRMWGEALDRPGFRRASLV